MCNEIDEIEKSKFKEKVKTELSSVFSSFRPEIMSLSVVIGYRLTRKLDKLSKRENRPLRNGSHCNMAMRDGREFPEIEFDDLIPVLITP